jgi:hypothetical protein
LLIDQSNSPARTPAVNADHSAAGVRQGRAGGVLGVPHVALPGFENPLGAHIAAVIARTRQTVPVQR